MSMFNVSAASKQDAHAHSPALSRIKQGLTTHCHTICVKLQPLESATCSSAQVSRTETEAHLEAAQANTGLRARLRATMMMGMATSQPRMACPSAAKPFPEKMSYRHKVTVDRYVGHLQRLVTGAPQASAAWHAR